MTDDEQIKPPRERARYALYLTAAALTSACGLVVEIVAGRMLAPYLGMSIYTWTAIIAVVLAGFSLGHWIGGWFAMWPVRKAERSLGWVLLAAAISTAASLVLIRLLSGPLIGLGLGNVTTIVVLTGCLFFLPSLFVGIPSPILTRLAIDGAPDRMGRRLGAMFAAGALGSIGGTLAAGFVFIAWLGTIGTILTVAAVYVAGGLVFFLRSGRPHGGGSVVMLAVAAGLLGAVWAVGDRVLAFQSSCTRETQYYCIRVVDIGERTGRPSRLMVLDHLGHGMNVEAEPKTLLSPYVELQDLLVGHHLPGAGGGTVFDAFFVGGGAYTLPRAWQAKYPEARISVAEIDPAVTELAAGRLWFRPAPGMTVLHADARRALNGLPPSKRFDVVIGDAFHDIAVPQHLVTREFFETVAARLTPRGIYVMNVVDVVKRPRLLLSVAKTLRRAFATVEVWIDLEQARSGGRATFVVLAGSVPTPVDRMTSPAFPGRAWYRFPDSLLRPMADKLKPIELTDDFAPVDRLLRGG